MTETPERVHLLVFRSDGVGGVARTVINLANELVKSRPVELISLFRLRKDPSYPIDTRVEQTSLLGIQPRSGIPVRPRSARAGQRKPWQAELDRRPTTLVAQRAEPSALMSAYTDHVLAEKIRSITSGVIISTRPSLHVAAVRYGQPGVLLLGQDHLNFIDRSRNRAIMHALAEAVPRLDAYVVLTKDDATDYRQWAPEGSRVERIPNGHTTPTADHGAALDQQVVVSAGRFVPRKGFDRLVEAWGPIAREFPDWQLHFYGSGPEEDAIRQAIHDRGLTESVHLMGYSNTFDRVLVESSAYAMGSTSEGFPMVLVEAMGKGLPIVAFDCPRGPADTIEDGVNGRLVPDGDIAGFTQALREIIADPALRRSMGGAGLVRARDYEMANIAAQWETLIEELRESRSTRAPEDHAREEGRMTESGQRPRSTVVVVAGSGRSGTSTIAGVLKMIGLRVPPPEVPGDASNPRGFFEPQWVVEQHSRLLRASGARLTDARPGAFAATEETGSEGMNRHEVGTWLRSQVEPGVDLVVKDPRSSWFLPMWRQAAIDADIEIAFLTMLRHPAEVVGSKDHYYKAAKVGDTRRHAQTRGVGGWINVALQTEFSTRDVRRTFIRYNDLLSDWRADGRPDRTRPGSAGCRGRRPRGGGRRRRLRRPGPAPDPRRVERDRLPRCGARPGPGDLGPAGGARRQRRVPRGGAAAAGRLPAAVRAAVRRRRGARAVVDRRGERSSPPSGPGGYREAAAAVGEAPTPGAHPVGASPSPYRPGAARPGEARAASSVAS